ncbi:bifunctional transcriptional activator/DNA repair enzyme AdaA [Sporosarcina sp. Te-1]|uniref:bifunctional transcriptional activator/DNA repair enzyme AdaA n=1 Tax=Sporosarcina sp. Te-1 TaxID=2818390 RepID=UPI001A9DA96E|nr:Ada metal-binding domain-containing protein [Sporosarcina sp. Te-1]QTD41054.1 methylphosphotriester-DNA--protein-cysteine methyltransferase family protein [Sporosarcina sp. Te-1]
MTNQNYLSKEMMWKATASCDATYDGVFFYAVKTTGIYCRPSCKSRIPNDKNVTFFWSADDAQRAGYRPCKRCRPDLRFPKYDPLAFILEDTIQLIKTCYKQNISSHDIASNVGVSRFHLNRIFKDRMGCTPRMYMERIRINKAKELLLTTEYNSTQIGYQIGYQSISSFYNAFKRNTGFSPSQFRAIHASNTLNHD